MKVEPGNIDFNSLLFGLDFGADLTLAPEATVTAAPTPVQPAIVPKLGLQ